MLLLLSFFFFFFNDTATTEIYTLSLHDALPISVGLELDVRLDGTGATGTVGLQALRLKLGGSGFAAGGSWDLGRQAGEVRLRDLVVLPQDLELVLAGAELEGPVRGEADLKSDGKTAGLDLRLDAGGGRIAAKVTASLEESPVWD